MPPITEVTLIKLAKNLINWEAFATLLHVSSVKVSHVKAENPGNVEQQIFQMLMIWQRGWDPSENNHQMGAELIYALEQHGMPGLASLYKQGKLN